MGIIKLMRKKYTEHQAKTLADRAAYQAELRKAEGEARKKWARQQAKITAKSRYEPRGSLFGPPPETVKTKVKYVYRTSKKKTPRKRKKRRRRPTYSSGLPWSI